MLIFANPKAVSGLEIIELKQGEMLAILPENHHLAKEKLSRWTNWQKNLLFYWKKGIIMNHWRHLNELEKLILHRTNYHISLHQTEPPIYRTLAIGYKNEKNDSTSAVILF